MKDEKFDERDPLRLATNRQLWKLNSLGRLELVERARPITSPVAFEALRAALAPEGE